MSQNFPDDLSLGYGLVALCQLTGARSSWLQKGTILIDTNLSFAESRIEQMAALIDEMATSYATVGREMESLFFGYEEHFLLTVCERSLRVVLFFPADHDFHTMTDAITACRRFLRKNRPKIDSTLAQTHPVFLQAGRDESEPAPTPVPQPPDQWQKIQPEFLEMLSMEMGDEQAKSFIERTVKSLKARGADQFHDHAQTARNILAKVPIPDQRERLQQKLEDFLKKTGSA